MRNSFVAGLIAAVLMGAPVARAACGESVQLTVKPPGKLDEVAVVLRRRLEAAGASSPSVVAEGPATLRVLLPAGAAPSLLTRPGKIEFRLVATPEAPGAVALQKWSGEGTESVEPQVIVNESHLREVQAREEKDPASGASVAVLTFRLDPTALKNLLTATMEAVGRKLAIVVDDRVVVDPIIRAPLASASGEIAGGFTMASANELVELLHSGRLPADVVIASREPAACP